ncbi:MAG: hypothetical protein ABI647_23070 [Gemmatimonadota bacterium]
MTPNTVRAIIAIAMVFVFIGLTAVMALFPLFSSKNVEIKDYADFFVKIASVYTGILGVIVGYYFARVQGGKPPPDGAARKPPAKDEDA